MSNINDFEDLYDGLSSSEPVPLFVAPRIRYSYKKSDYLYLFYKRLLDSPDFKIIDVNTAGHLQFVLHQLIWRDSILHYHWIQFTGFWSIFGFLYKLFCIQLFLSFGGKLVWSLHNKIPPDCTHEWLHIKARKWLAKKADRLVIECESVIPDLSIFFNITPDKFRIQPHPGYPSQLIPRAAAIEAIHYRFDTPIKIQDRIFLMFGHISSYKQICKVQSIFEYEPFQKKLLIVGPVKKGQMEYYKKIRKASQEIRNVILIPKFIKEDFVPEFFNAADYLIFNYREVFASGGVPLAKSYDKTIILPEKGCLADQEKSKNLIYFKSQEELKQIIQNL